MEVATLAMEMDLVVHLVYMGIQELACMVLEYVE
jgi:hypothetical protein